MVTADRKARNRRTVDLLFGVSAEIGLATTLWIFSWGGSPAGETPFGATASMTCAVAGLVLVAAALVVRFIDERAATGAVLAALIAVGLVVAWLVAMAFIVMTADVGLWWQLLWSAGSAAVLGFGLARVRAQRRPAEGRS